MKIAIYAICKNEENFVKNFLETSKDADGIFIADTGSTDKTVSLLKSYSKKIFISDKVHIQSVYIKPWRFDLARNANLAMIPDDYDVCICLDFDEVLVGNWRQAIENAWEKYKTEQTAKELKTGEPAEALSRFRYKYIWNWQADGSPGVTYYGDKIHNRTGFKWVMPVHETLELDIRCGNDGANQVYLDTNEFSIHHHADNNKPRSQYLPLLKLAVCEAPFNDRQAHYYARELYFYQKYEESIEEFERHLSLPSATWKAERSASYRYMGHCYWAIQKYDEALISFNKAIEEDPTSRESWVALAQGYRALGKWEDTIRACKGALDLDYMPVNYITDPNAWSDWPKKMLEEAELNIKN